MRKVDQEDEESGDEEGVEGEGEGDKKADGEFNMFGWLQMINRVSDRTKLDWNQVWEMNVYLFFNYLSFDIEYKKMEERELMRWKQQH